MDLTSYIASMSVSMAQANVAQSVSTAMLSKSCLLYTSDAADEL